MRFRAGLIIATAMAGASACPPVSAQPITPEALLSQVIDGCNDGQDECLATLIAVNRLVPRLTLTGQATFGARLAFLVLSNPALEPLIREAVRDSNNIVVAAGYNATNGESEDVVVPTLASPA